jgi:dinuclear metal center YbgI/SA1388 family protein
MFVQIKSILNHLESIAPSRLQESYDNAGLITGDASWVCSGILFCLDSTEAIVDEAISLGCNLIVAHHPIVFKGLRRLNGKNYVERTIIKAIKNDIAIYAIHTNLDNVYKQGVNSKIAEKLGLHNTRILAPKVGENDLEIGAGVIGEFKNSMNETNFLQFVKTTMKAGVVRYTKLLGRDILKVAVCGGTGSFLLQDAIRAGADAFVTADFKYHEFFDADEQILIADIGHFESEQFTIELLFSLVSEKFPNFALHCTKRLTNPVNYL